MSLQWIEYKGKKILYVDYKGLKTKEALLLLDEEAAEVRKSKEKILILDDMRNFYVVSEFLQKGKLLGKELSPKIAKMAQVFSIIGIKKVLVNTFIKFSGMNLKFFNESEMEKAKDYLVS